MSVILDLMNSKFIIVGVLLSSLWFTVYYNETHSPYIHDRQALNDTLSKLANNERDLAAIANSMSIKLERHDVRISELRDRLDRIDDRPPVSRRRE